MSLKSVMISASVLLASVSLAGCAGHHNSDQALQQAAIPVTAG